MNALILSCSARKTTQPSGVAFKLYDGPTYRVFRKHFKNNFKVFILSAKYGLIDHDTVINNYDQKMDNRRVYEISRGGLPDFKVYDRVYCKLRPLYLKALLPGLLPVKDRVLLIKGRPVEQLSRLKQLLLEGQ